MNKKGIDISQWQGNLTLEDFYAIKNSGIEFVIIRCGYTGYGINKNKNIDKYFENNYKLAKQVGLLVGTYYYSCATTLEEAEEEANYILSLISGKNFEYPIVIDTEDNHDITNINYSNKSQYSIGKSLLTSIIIKLCDIIESAGYYVSIYASTYWFKNQLILNDLKKYDKWIAQWSDTVNFSDSYGLWQYSSTGNIDGIDGYIDFNYSYKDYKKIMIDNQLNGFITENINNNQDDIDDNELSNEVLEDELIETKNKIVKIFKAILKFIKFIIKLFK